MNDRPNEQIDIEMKFMNQTSHHKKDRTQNTGFCSPWATSESEPRHTVPSHNIPTGAGSTVVHTKFYHLGNLCYVFCILYCIFFKSLSLSLYWMYRIDRIDINHWQHWR